jgi:hypothetical protein
MRVTIHRCPVCPVIGTQAANQATALRRELGIEVQVLDGYRGEYTVTANGRVIAEKTCDWLPSLPEVQATLRRQSPGRADT